MADNSYSTDEAPSPESGADVDSKGKSDAKAKLHEEAKARFKLAQDAEADNRRLAADDDLFCSGEQWDFATKQSRADDGRPCLTVNRLPQFVRQVTNDQRQNRPAIKVSPVDDQGDPETARIIQGLIRHIEYASNADAAYDTAFEGAVKGGWGYWRVHTQYADPQSFDQELVIKRIPDRFSVTFDPFSVEPDGSDANYAFVSERISREEYEEKYPDSKLATGDGWEMAETQEPSWMGSAGALIVEQFYKVYESKTLCQLSNGQVVFKEAVQETLKPLAAQGTQAEVVKERQARVPSVKWCKFNASEVLEETDWLGQWIPIIPVYGSEQILNGKRVLEGIIRQAKDSQKMLNFWKTAETEAIALAPRAPFIAAEGQLEGYKHEWEQANRRNFAVLTYKPKSVDGVPLPPPQRNAIEPAVQAITQAAMMSADDMKAVTGIYDASLGARSNETSGVAIQRRNQQAQTSVYHFVDNLTRSIKHTGRVLVDLIPHIYDTARAARIIGDDGEQQMVRVNDPSFVDPNTGKPALYDLSAGKYDVTVDVGPNYATKRQEAASTIQELIRANPQLMQITGDLLMANLDFQNAKEISSRLKKLLPPPLQDQQPGGPGQVPPQAQAQMQQMGQMIDKLTQELHAAKDPLELKRMELESRERIEFAKIQADLEIQAAKMGSLESMEMLRQEVAQIEGRLKLLNIDSPFQPLALSAAQGMPQQPPQAGSAPPSQQQMPPMPHDAAESAEGEMPGHSGAGMGGAPTGGFSPGQSMDEETPTP